jgi:mycothiol synthase
MKVLLSKRPDIIERREIRRCCPLDQRPQLRMRHDDLNSLAPLEAPAGYRMLRFAAGDERIWVALLQENGELGEWNLERAERLFTATKGAVWRESIHFIVHGQRPVATACVQLHADSPGAPELGWVAVSPDCRRQGLGRSICLAVLHFMREQGYLRCFLRTDDRRLPAIKTYIRLGFVPDMEYHSSFPARWQAVWAALERESGA